MSLMKIRLHGIRHTVYAERGGNNAWEVRKNLTGSIRIGDFKLPAQLLIKQDTDNRESTQICIGTNLWLGRVYSSWKARGKGRNAR